MNEDFLKSTVLNSHAVILEIPRGFGFEFAKEKLDIPKESEILDILPRTHDKQKTETINVEDIEDLQKKMRVKNHNQQFLIFHNAEKMNEQAQNKFLKLLEEPRQNLHFILITNSIESLLLTVRSRAQKIKIPPISHNESIKILKKYKLDEKQIRQIIFLVDGLPAELQKLASDKKYLKQKIESVEIAKKWLSSSKFDKLVIASSFKTDREKVLIFIEQCLNILRATTNQKTATQNAKELKKLLACYHKIQQNGNIRLNLLNLILN